MLLLADIIIVNLLFLSKQLNLTCRRQPYNGNSLILRRFADGGAKATNPNKEKVVGKWLLGCSGMVFAAVVLGGATYYYVTYYSVRSVLNKALDPTSKKY